MEKLSSHYHSLFNGFFNALKASQMDPSDTYTASQRVSGVSADFSGGIPSVIVDRKATTREKWIQEINADLDPLMRRRHFIVSGLPCSSKSLRPTEFVQVRNSTCALETFLT